MRILKEEEIRLETPEQMYNWDRILRNCPFYPYAIVHEIPFSIRDDVLTEEIKQYRAFVCLKARYVLFEEESDAIQFYLTWG